MSVQQLQTGYAASLVVRLLDATGDPVLGVPFSAITAIYKKQGDTTWTTKAVLSSDWSAGPEGRYLLSFSALELGTDGRFTYRVLHASADTFTGDIDLVEDWADVEAQLVALLDGLSGKVSTEAIKTIKKEQDLALITLDQKVIASNTKIQSLQAQVAAMKRMVDSLS